MEDIKEAILADIAKRTKGKEDKAVNAETIATSQALNHAVRLKLPDVSSIADFLDALDEAGYEAIDLKDDNRFGVGPLNDKTFKRKIFIRKTALPNDAILYTRKGFLTPIDEDTNKRTEIIVLFTKDREFTPKAYWDDMVAQRVAKYGKDWQVTESLAQKTERRTYDKQKRLIKQRIKTKRAFERELKEIEKAQAELERETNEQ